MDIVDKISVPLVIHIAVLHILGTIFLCYGIAVCFGHVPSWLPMISACAVNSPEKYPFRIGMIVGACLMQVEVLLAYHGNKGYSRSKFCLVTGTLASIGLGIVGAVNEEENNTVHSSSAGIFFLCYLLYMIATSWHSMWKESSVSLNSTILKIMCTLVTFAALVILVLMSRSWSKNKVHIAVCEWSATLSILLFQWTYAYDLIGLFLCETETHDHKIPLEKK